MWLQILCFLMLSLLSKTMAELVEPRELILCCSIKVPPKSHDSYYEEDEYHKPKRYGYGDHYSDHRGGYVDHSKNVGYKPINPPKHRAKYHKHDKPKLYLNEHDDIQQYDSHHKNDHYTNYGYKLNTSPYNHQIQHKHNERRNKKTNKHDNHQYDNGYHNVDSYKGNHNYDDYHYNEEKYDDVKEQYKGYENDHQLNTYLKTEVHKEDQHKTLYDDLLTKLLRNYLPHTYLPTTYYNPDEKHSKLIYDYILPGILRRLQGPEKQNQTNLVTIIANEKRKQHMYPKKFNETILLQDFKHKTKDDVQSKKMN